MVSGTSFTPTRWTRRLVLRFLLPTLAALAGVLVTAVPYVSVTLERHEIDTLAGRLLAEVRVVGEALPWTAGDALDAFNHPYAYASGCDLHREDEWTINDG